ncbi:MAG: hypothetical protein K8I82_21900 [Anaerolineae bacterium]|jgi:hypothetical protein|nr:hypothetical protein [Anaerolineae bacterium]
MNDQHRKIRPHSETAVISPIMIIGGGLLAGLLLVIAMVVALMNDNDLEEGEIIFATNTPAPLPTYASGAILAEGDLLYVVEATAFSFAAAADSTNTEQSLERCAEVTVSRQTENSDLVYLENDQLYWVYTRLNDAEKGWNGWLPLDALAPERPADCG